MAFSITKHKWAFIFIMALSVSSCGGGKGNADSSPDIVAIEKIADYAKNGGSTPTVEDYIQAGVNGVNSENLDKINNRVSDLSYEEVDSSDEIQAILDELGISIPDIHAPIITLKGDSSIKLQKGDAYKEAGATATDDKDGVVAVVITGNVDINKVGSYTITYTAVDKANNKATLTRTVSVEEVICAQVITHAYNPTTKEEKDFPTPCDVPEGWIVGIPPADKDVTPPIISRLGNATVTINVGDAYNDAGATASDNIDGNITQKINTDNPVNINVAGTYKVLYNVDDKAGNHAIQIVRTVIVKALHLPAREYGLAGEKAVADPIVESVNGNSVIIIPEGVSAAKPVPVVFFAPGFRNKDYTNYQTLLEFIASHGYAVIFANDIDGFKADSIKTHLKEMVNNPAIKPLLDTTRIGIIGHSSGGGHAFNILKEFSNTEGLDWGANGRFLMALEPWFAFGMTESDMKSLPSNSNIIIQQYGVGGNNNVKNTGTDPRIPLTEYYLLDSIVDSQKDYQIFENADHGYPKLKKYSDMQGILKPLDALMELTFNKVPDGGAQQIALEVGSDDPYSDGQGIQTVKLITDYPFKCHGANTIINYCAIHPDALPPESDFRYIVTNTSKPKPDLGASFIDQEFGKKVTRFTDRFNQEDTPTVDSKGNRRSRGNAQPYPKTQAWNSDMTMIRMNYRLYDAETLTELPITSGTNSLSELYSINGALNEKKWSTQDPNVFYGVYNGSGTLNGNFWKGTINRNTNKIKYDLVASFSTDEITYDRFTLGKYEGNIDFDDKYVVFAARKTGLKYLTAIVYDIQNNIVRKTLDFPAVEWPDEGQVFDWMSVSPLGNHILMSSGGKIDQYDMDLNFVRNLAASGGHGDLGVDQSGGEAYVQYEYGANNGIWIYRLRDGLRVGLLPDKYNGGHISCRNYNRKGWCYASTTALGYKNIVAIRLDYSGSDNHIVNLFTQTHTSKLVQSFGNVSPDGKRILFESDWGDAGVAWPDRDTYQVR